MGQGAYDRREGFIQGGRGRGGGFPPNFPPGPPPAVYYSTGAPQYVTDDRGAYARPPPIPPTFSQPNLANGFEVGRGGFSRQQDLDTE